MCETGFICVFFLSTDSDYSKSRKKRRGGRSERYSKPKSLSPLSKRMASMGNESNVASMSRPILPTTFSYDQQPFGYPQPDDYEQKVCSGKPICIESNM